MTAGTLNSTAERLAQAERLMAEHAYEPAHALCMEVLATHPRAAGAWFLLGVLAADHDNPGKAAELFGRAATLDLDDPRAPAHLARCLIAMNRRDEALAQAQIAEARKPADALTLDILGVVFRQVGLPSRAIGHFEAALAMEPGRASLACNLALARQDVGDADGAEAAFAQALALDPGLHQAWSSRVLLRRQTAEQNFLPDLETQFAAARGSAAPRLHLGHALAKTHEDLGNFEIALDWLIRAKAAMGRQVGYDPRADADLFAAARATCPTATAGARGATSEGPIFVLGLPFGGAALVEQILSQHREVASVDDLTSFGLVLQRMTGSSGALLMDEAALEAAGKIDFRKAGQAYLQMVGARLAGAGRSVDRAPLNIIWAGLIHRAMPQARIVGLRRHPMDACMETYRRLLPTDPWFDYAYDLTHTAAYYAGFERLMAHWRQVLPADRFTEVALEDLVADPEGETRRLLDFCGLDFDPNCLAQGSAAAPGGSALMATHANSIGRWRSYGPGLAPLREALESAGVRL